MLCAVQFLEGGVRSLVEGAMGPTKQAITDLKAQIGKVRGTVCDRKQNRVILCVIENKMRPVFPRGRLLVGVLDKKVRSRRV